MSNMVLKAGYVEIKKSDKRVIDSNDRISDKLKTLSEELAFSGYSQEELADDFTEGLNAEQVGMLFDDPEQAPVQPAFDTAQIEEMIREAEENAAQIVNDANAQHDEIISEAQREGDALRKQAQDDGYREGYDRGYEEGVLKAQELERELNERELLLQNEYEARISALEPQFVEVLSKIYEHVFHVDLSGKTELILYLLKDAIRGIEGGKNFLVHVSSADKAFVDEHKEELRELVSASGSVEVIEDMTLGQSECFIEAESGIFDCGLDTELELLGKELKLLSYSENAE